MKHIENFTAQNNSIRVLSTLQDSQVTLSDLTPYKSIPQKFPHLFTCNQWSWAVKQRKHNGLGKAFCKVGKKLFVNERVLAKCINQQSEE